MRKLALTLLCGSLLQPTVFAQPPTTAQGGESKTYHGIRVPDPYHWLEAAQDPKVKAWIEAQNRHAEETMAGYPGREALAKRIQQLALTAPTRTSPQLAGQTMLFMKDTPPAAQPVLVGQNWPLGAEKVLVDTNADANPSAITDFWPSPSGKYVAYGTAVGGSELTTIFFVETATGKKLADVLPNAAGGTTPPSLAWDADESGLTYVKLPKDSLFNASLYHHKLGVPVARRYSRFRPGPIAGGGMGVDHQRGCLAAVLAGSISGTERPPNWPFADPRAGKWRFRPRRTFAAAAAGSGTTC
jgi:prolyl oligopeptidase